MKLLTELDKQITIKKAELAELETAKRVLSGLNGHAARKLKAMDHTVAALAEQVTPPANPRFAGRTHSAAAKEKIRKAAKRRYSKRSSKRSPKAVANDAGAATIRVPSTLEPWRYRTDFDPAVQKKLTLAVIHHLTADQQPTNYSSIADVVEALGWHFNGGMLTGVSRWRNAKRKNGVWTLTARGEASLQETEARLLHGGEVAQP